MKRLLLTIILVSTALTVFAQRRPDSLADYHRSSLYSVLITHPNLEYGNSIASAFLNMPMPDKFNDHNLNIRAFESSAKRVKTKAKSKQKDKINLEDIERFITNNSIAKSMWAKWFNRDPRTGVCNLELIGERGLYDASQLDISIADLTIMGREQLADRGESLIGNTFLLVNDITFADTGKRTGIAAAILSIAGDIFSVATGRDISPATDLVAIGVDMIDGFNVNVTSYLYRLAWDESRLQDFYASYYVSARHDEAERTRRREAFDAVSGADTTLFRLEYVGRTTTMASIVSSKYFSNKSKDEQMFVACTRAVDKAIVQLQREYEEFKVNVPIYRVNPDGTVDVQIGLKEGVNNRSTYEVLMPVIDNNGHMSYRKVGSISPIEGKIWDNRFGALDEARARLDDPNAKTDSDAEGGNAFIDATTFRVNGVANVNNFIGCVVREARVHRAN